MSTTSAAGIYTTCIVLPTLDLVAIGLRLYARTQQRLRLRLDDWLQIPAVLLFIVIAITGLIGVSNNVFGYPTPKVAAPTEPPESLLLAEKLWFVIQLVQIFCQGVTRLAALFFYKRIFVTHRGLLSYIIWIMVGLVITWMFAFAGFYLGVCGGHFSAAWSGWIGFEDYCIQSEYFEQGYAISDFILDTLILLIPLPLIWHLHATIGRKLGITGVFLLAWIGYGAAIARVVVFVELAQGALTQAGAHQLPDIQAIDTQALWFTNLEIGLSILAINLPSIWGLMTQSPMSSKFVASLRRIRSIDDGSHASSALRSDDSTFRTERLYKWRKGDRPHETTLDIGGHVSSDTVIMPVSNSDLEACRNREGIVVSQSINLTEICATNDNGTAL